MSLNDAFLKMAADMAKLRDRLAPDNPTAIIVKANQAQHTPGSLIQTVPINTAFNTIVNNLQRGTVNVFFSGNPSGQPDLVLQPTDNPLLIPLGLRRDKNVSFVVSSTSPTGAQGSILLELY